MRLLTAPNAPVTVLCLADGRDLAFAEYGDPDGVPVFAFHGTPGSHLQLAPADAAARAAGVRLIAPDRPGYGLSSFVRGRRLADWPTGVAAIADHLGVDRFAVLGVSGGGPHALACAVVLPDRLSAVGVVSSPSPFADAPDAQRARLRRLRRLAAVPGLVRLVAALLIVAVRRFPLAVLHLARQAMPEADRRVVEDLSFRSYYLDAIRRTSPSAAKAVAQDVALFAHDWRLALRDISVPVKIWHGADDRLVEPWNADVLAKSVPAAFVAIVAGEGHLLFAEYTADILRELAAMALQHGPPAADEDHQP